MKRDAVVQIRLTPQEKATLQAKAQDQGMSLSQWMRWKLLRRTK